MLAVDMSCFSAFFSGARFDDGAGGDNEVQRTMLELINQLDGFDPRGNIKVLMATNRPDTLDPALMRPGRLDRKIEFSLPDLEVKTEFDFRKKFFNFCLFIHFHFNICEFLNF
jgi:ATP-dependent 26S proteasome regulatory subunit